MQQSNTFIMILQYCLGQMLLLQQSCASFLRLLHKAIKSRVIALYSLSNLKQRAVLASELCANCTFVNPPNLGKPLSSMRTHRGTFRAMSTCSSCSLALTIYTRFTLKSDHADMVIPLLEFGGKTQSNPTAHS